MPALDAHLAIAGHGVRGHRDDAQLGRKTRVASRLRGANPSRRRDAIHFRHLRIHEHERVGFLLHRLDRLAAVLHDIGRVTEIAELQQRDLLVHGIVFGDEDARRDRWPGLRSVRGPASAAWSRKYAGRKRRRHDARVSVFRSFSGCSGFSSHAASPCSIHLRFLQPFAARREQHERRVSESSGRRATIAASPRPSMSGMW